MGLLISTTLQEIYERGGGLTSNSTGGALVIGGDQNITVGGSTTLTLSSNGSSYNLNAGTIALATAAQTIIEAINEVNTSAFTPSYYFGLASGTGSTDTANTVYTTSVVSSRITQASTDGAFTVTDAGIYFVSSHDETFGSGFFAQAVYSPKGAGRVLMFRGRADPSSAGGWHYSNRGLLNLGAGGTFELRPDGKHPGTGEDFPVVIYRIG
jgi:hypothetical protein